MKGISILALLALVGLAACSAKIEGGSGPTPKWNPPGPSLTTELEGKWATTCVPLSGGFAAKSKFTIHNNEFSGDTTVYSDLSCTNVYQSGTKSGTFLLGGADAKVSGAYDIDWISSSEHGYDIYENHWSYVYFGTNPGDSAATRASTINYQLKYYYQGQ